MSRIYDYGMAESGLEMALRRQYGGDVCFGMDYVACSGEVKMVAVSNAPTSLYNFHYPEITIR